MDDKVQQSWEDFLNPAVMRQRLISASIYIAGFESLKDSIIGRIRFYFWNGFNEKGDIIDPEYQSDVLSRNNSPVYASLDWLKDMDAIDAADIAAFERVKNYRNNLAHELLHLLGPAGMPTDFEQCFQEMLKLLHKIELWWIKNLEIPANPDLRGKEINEEGILPGPVWVLQLLCDIALGSDEESRFYYEEMRKRSRRGET